MSMPSGQLWGFFANSLLEKLIENVFYCRTLKRNELSFSHSFLCCAQCFRESIPLYLPHAACVSLAGWMDESLCMLGGQECWGV